MQNHRQKLVYTASAAGILLLSMWAMQPHSVRADEPSATYQGQGTNGTVPPSTQTPPPTAPTATPIATAPTSTPIATAPASEGRITIIKEAQPKSIQDFTFFGPKGMFMLDDDSGVEGEDDELSTRYTISVPPGRHNLSEAMNPSWYLADITCSVAGAERFQRTVSLTVAAGEEVTCTFVNQHRVEVLANVFLDSNGNGEQDAGEAGVAGFEVRLYESGDLLNHRIVSDASGQALFTRRIPGDYQVCLLLHAEDGSNNSEGDLTINNPDLRCQSVSLPPGQSAQVNFGLSADEVGQPTSTPIATAPATPTAVPTAPPTATPVPTAPAALNQIHVSSVTMRVHYYPLPDGNEDAIFPMYMPLLVR
ncbi:MAG: SdrD B-like domain-containing protein [Caldilineaceae bacterium]